VEHLYYIDNGGLILTGVTLQLDEWYCLYSNAGVLKVQKSTDGLAWTDAFSLPITLIFRLIAYVILTDVGKMFYPKLDLLN
jgi:hypothetical protein